MRSLGRLAHSRDTLNKVSVSLERIRKWPSMAISETAKQRRVPETPHLCGLPNASRRLCKPSMACLKRISGCALVSLRIFRESIQLPPWRREGKTTPAAQRNQRLELLCRLCHSGCRPLIPGPVAVWRLSCVCHELYVIRDRLSINS